MLKNFLKVSLIVGLAVAALSPKANAQTVKLQIVGSSAFFTEAGLGANLSTGPINAPCVWSASGGVVATDPTGSSPNNTDSGSAWVAWTKGSTPQPGLTSTSCTNPGTDSLVYAYLNTDSVVGNRCLFNACTLNYSAPTGTPIPAGLILSSNTANCGTTGECALPSTIVGKLGTTVANVAATDIRPEDAEFATARALVTPCAAQIGTTQYLGLGYSSGSAINSAIPGSTKKFNVISFKLPSTAPTVTVVGATPIVVAVSSSGDANGFATKHDITSAALAKYLDGTTNITPGGEAANVLVREPLSGTYNTMEYNVPNTTVNQTSQDVGKTQLVAQQNCTGTPKIANPKLSITAANGAIRARAIGTGEELAQVASFVNLNPTDNNNNIGYGFWSVSNFSGFGVPAVASHSGYYTVDGVDPLNSTASGCAYTGVIPISGTTALSCVDLHNVASGAYPIYSLLRMVNTDTTISTTVGSLATAAQDFVSFGTTTSRPDFIRPANMTSIREHFTPPLAVAGSVYPSTLTDGDKQFTTLTSCTSLPEAGGDVGGVVVPLRIGTNNNSTWCATAGNTTHGQINGRR